MYMLTDRMEQAEACQVAQEHFKTDIDTQLIALRADLFPLQD